MDKRQRLGLLSCTLALGWCPAIGRHLRKQFSCFWGLRVARALFDRFGLEQPQGEIDEDGAWFFDILPDKSVACTISIPKWKIWSVIALSALQFPIPQEALYLLIASNYLTRYYQRHKGDAAEPVPHDTYTCVPYYKCSAAVAKLDKVMNPGLDFTQAQEEALVTNYYNAVLRMPSRVPSLSDCLFSTFDVSEPLGRLVALWLCYQIQLSNKQSLEWLAALEMQAADGGGGEVGKLVLLFLKHYHARYPQQPMELSKYETLFRLVPKIEWDGIDVSGAARQLLEELVSAKLGGRESCADVGVLNSWTGRQSIVRKQKEAQHELRSRNESVRIGKLLYFWSRTEKGRAALETLNTMCSVTDAYGFVEHLQSTVRAGNLERCKVLAQAGKAVFGDKLGEAFFALCVNTVLWKEDVCLEVEEIGNITEMVRWGWFQVNPPFQNQRACLNKMILYLAYAVLEDHLDLQLKNKRDIRMDCDQVSHCCAGHPSVPAGRPRGLYWLMRHKRATGQPRQPRTCI